MARNWGDVRAEAMATGLAVVSTNVGDAQRIVGTCGYVISPGDRSSLITSIDQIAAMPLAQREFLGKNARDRIMSQFSLERAVSRFDQLLLYGKLPDEDSGT